MGKAGVAVRETIDIPGRSASEVTQLVIDELRRHPGYQIAAAGPGSHHVVRTYRWLQVLRRTEAATVVVVDGARGALVTASGRLMAGDWEAAKGAARGLCARSAAPPAPAVGRPASVMFPPIPAPTSEIGSAALPPPPLVDYPAEHTIARVAVPRTPAPIVHHPADDHTVFRVQAPRTEPTIALRLPGGQAVAIDRDTLLGRDPAPMPGAAGAPRLVPVEDPLRQISKTHLLVRLADDGLLVEDLHSTNGTKLQLPGAPSTPLVPAVAVLAPLGSWVRLGSLAIEVVAGG